MCALVDINIFCLSSKEQPINYVLNHHRYYSSYNKRKFQLDRMYSRKNTLKYIERLRTKKNENFNNIHSANEIGLL